MLPLTSLIKCFAKRYNLQCSLRNSKIFLFLCCQKIVSHNNIVSQRFIWIIMYRILFTYCSSSFYLLFILQTSVVSSLVSFFTFILHPYRVQNKLDNTYMGFPVVNFYLLFLIFWLFCCFIFFCLLFRKVFLVNIGLIFILE